MHRLSRFYLKWKKRVKKVKAINYFVLVALFLVGIAGSLTAQTLRPEFSQSEGTVVTATVGTNRLTLSGYQSPFASIILKTDTGQFLASTTADANGYFSISDVLINGSTLRYCFQASDFKRLGISESCIDIPGPIVGDVTITDIFLPPTIGLLQLIINAGEDGVIYGYSMPGAVVTITINSETLMVTADSSGYYTYLYRNVPAGVFTISATASLDDTASLDPTNTVTLESKSIPQQITDEGEEIIDKGKDVIKDIGEKAGFDIWPFLLLALAFLTAIGILLYKLRLGPWMIIVDFFKKKKKMHHDWFLDKW